MLGFDKDPERPGVWIPNPKELERVDRILDIVQRHDSFKGACDAIASEGIVSKYGTPYRPDSLRRLIMSRKTEGVLEIQPKTSGVDHVIERPLSFGPVVDLGKLSRARAKVKEWDGFIRKTRVKKRTNLLTGILVHEDGSSFRGLSGTGRSGKKSFYYWTDKHRFGINAVELEAAVINAIACYKDDDEVSQYTAEAVRQLSWNITGIDNQIANLKSRATEVKKKEGKLIETILEKPTESVANWLEIKLKELQEERKVIGAGIQKLEREKIAIESSMPNPKDMKKTLQFVFENFGKSEPSVQRNFMRQLFQKIVVSEKNKVKLYWRFTESTKPLPPGCDAGGQGFALGQNWGDQRGSNPRHPESQSGALPAELWPPLCGGRNLRGRSGGVNHCACTDA